jgi:uncharacterized protein (DUF1778 family)
MKTKLRTRATTPPKPLKTETIRLRVTPEDKQALTKFAESKGLDLSVWLRQLAFRESGILPEAK